MSFSHVAYWENSGIIAIEGQFPQAIPTNRRQTSMGDVALEPFFNNDEEARTRRAGEQWADDLLGRWQAVCGGGGRIGTVYVLRPYRLTGARLFEVENIRLFLRTLHAFFEILFPDTGPGSVVEARDAVLDNGAGIDGLQTTIHVE